MFENIKKDILGKNYDLSIAFVPENKSRELNKKYRNKNKATNILSFPLSKNMGEIVLCPAVIKKEAKKFGRTPDQLLNFLVIHGMLHLKGYEHSSTMEALEKKYDQKYFSGDRCRLDDDTSRGWGISKRRKKS
ncbi:rRNA maturation RNase YbeY [Patescibacteria group bacterium]|nr:rRNA maturation RNase YbeY [Patescibacteria group bacterium]